MIALIVALGMAYNIYKATHIRDTYFTGGDR